MAVPLLVANVTPTAPALPPARVTVIVALPPVTFSATVEVAALNCKLPAPPPTSTVKLLLVAVNVEPPLGKNRSWYVPGATVLGTTKGHDPDAGRRQQSSSS